MVTMSNQPARHPLELSHSLDREQQAIHQQRPNALAITEIFLSITRHLDSKSIVHCLSVCRDWYEVLLPQVYSTVEMKDTYYPLTIIPHLNPSRDTLFDHSALIRRVVITSRTIDILANHRGPGRPLFLPNLESFHQNWRQDRPGKPFKESMVLNLIRTHRLTLRDLRLYVICHPTLLDTAIRCVQLEKCSIKHLELQSLDQGTDRFLSLWSRLRSLDITGPWVRESGSTQLSDEAWARLMNANDTRLQDLTMSYSAGYIKDNVVRIQDILIQKSPHLVRLFWLIEWSPYNRQEKSQLSMMAEITRAVPTASSTTTDISHFHRLESLTVCHTTFENQDLRTVLLACPALTDLDLNKTSFDMESFKVLQGGDLSRLQTSLRSLSLNDCRKLTGAAVQSILCSMSGLEVFQADYIRASDVLMDNRPWVCTRLSELSLAFIVPIDQGKSAEGQEDSQLDKMLLNRLSGLRSLETLNLITNRVVDWRGSHELYLKTRVECHLRVDLEHGLDQLRTLKLLRSIQGRNGRWTVSEAKWILDNLPCCTSVLGFSFSRDASLILRNSRLGLP